MHFPLLAVAQVERDPAWDAAFFPTDGWAGGDANYSVDLRDGRVLWLFADTWIGRIADGRRLPGTRLVNNTLAIQPVGESGQPPPAESIRFHWGPDDAENHPTAWIVPDGELIGPDGPSGWYWPADGAVVSTPEGSERLVVFLWRMGRRDGKGGAWDFKSIEGAIATIDNPRDPVQQWRPIQHRQPHDRKGTHWGTEVLAVPASGQRGGEDFYVFGARRASGGGWGSQLVLARVRGRHVERPKAWEFRTTDGWSADPDDAAALAMGLPTEFSISPVTLDGRTIWVMVHSQPLLGPRIMVRTASSFLGPWSEPVPIFTVTEVGESKEYFTYAAKGHPELSRPGELLVTYVVNAQSLPHVLDDASIYRPRFLRVPLTLMPPAP